MRLLEVTTLAAYYGRPTGNAQTYLFVSAGHANENTPQRAQISTPSAWRSPGHAGENSHSAQMHHVERMTFCCRSPAMPAILSIPRTNAANRAHGALLHAGNRTLAPV